MQEDLQKMQQRKSEEYVTGEAGAGMVKVTMNGHHNVLQVHVDSSLLQDDKELLEDLIVAAINDAVKRIAERYQGDVTNIAAGFSLPAGFKLPF